MEGGIAKTQLRNVYISGCKDFDKQNRRGESIYERSWRKFWNKNSDRILRNLKLDNAIKIIVKARTYFQDGDFSFLIWEQYNNWEGVILKEEVNGNEPAWLVRISGNKVNFVDMIINKKDIMEL